MSGSTTADRAIDAPFATASHSSVTLSRVCAILQALMEPPQELSVTELALRVGIPKSTVHRLISALRTEEFVEVIPSGQVRLASGLFRLAAAAEESVNRHVNPAAAEARSRS